jgi:hypothetical protein
MSWQGQYRQSRPRDLRTRDTDRDVAPAAYVDTNLLGSGRIAKAAIVGQQGGVWASSAGFTVSHPLRLPS